MARRSKKAIDDLIASFKQEDFDDNAGLLDERDLPRWKPLIDNATGKPYTFLAFCLKFLPMIESNFRGYDEAGLLMAKHVEATILGKFKMTVLSPPPRVGKSTMSIASWIWAITCIDGSFPVIFISANGDLARAHSRKALRLFIATGGKVSPKSKSVTNWRPHTDIGEDQYCIGSTSQINGRGSALMILDDCTGGRQASFSEAQQADLHERLTSDWISRTQHGKSGRGGNILWVEQRCSDRDQLARLIESENRTLASGGVGSDITVVHIPARHVRREDVLPMYPDSFKVVTLPSEDRLGQAVWKRLPEEILQRRESFMSEKSFNALYMADVSLDREKSGFSERLIQQLPASEVDYSKVGVLALDIAVIGDKSAGNDGHGFAVLTRGGHTMADKIIIEETGIWQGSPDELLQPIANVLAKYPNIGVIYTENAGGGYQLTQLMRKHFPPHIQLKSATQGGRSKQIRYEQNVSHFMAGRVVTPVGNQCLPGLIKSMKRLVDGKRGGLDEADACLYGIEYLGRLIESGNGFQTTAVNPTGSHQKAAQVIWSRGSYASNPEDNPSTEWGSWANGVHTYRMW